MESFALKEDLCVEKVRASHFSLLHQLLNHHHLEKTRGHAVGIIIEGKGLLPEKSLSFMSVSCFISLHGLNFPSL